MPQIQSHARDSRATLADLADVSPRTRSFKVRSVNALDHPEAGDRVTVSLGLRQVTIDLGGRRLQGRFDRRSRQIVGEYFDLGRYALSLEGSRLHCQVTLRHPDRGSSPSWIADEDDPGDGGRHERPSGGKP